QRNPSKSYRPSASACQKSSSAPDIGFPFRSSTNPLTLTGTPVTPGSRKLVLAGEFGRKKGPAVSSGVNSKSSSPTAGVGSSSAVPFSFPWPKTDRTRARKAIGALAVATAKRNLRLDNAEGTERGMPEFGLGADDLQQRSLRATCRFKNRGKTAPRAPGLVELRTQYL